MSLEQRASTEARSLRSLMSIGLLAFSCLLQPCGTHAAGSQQPTPVDTSPAQIDPADAATRIAQLAAASKYAEAIDLAGRLADATRAHVGADHADYGRVLYNLADLLTSAGRHAEATERYRGAIAVFEKLSAADPANPEWPRRLIGAHQQLVRAGDQPTINVEKAVAIVERLRSQRRLEAWEKDWPDQFERKLRRIAAGRLFLAENFAEALSMTERRAEIEQRSDIAKGPSRSAAARTLGDVAWAALFAGRPAKAVAASERALALAPDQLWLAANHAHALLLAGRRDAATAIYLRHKGEIIPDQGKWEAVVGADFAEFREHGIGDRRMDAIERALGVVDSPAVVEQRVKVLRAEGRHADALALIERHTRAVKDRHGDKSLAYAKALDALARYAYSWAPVARNAEWEAAQRQALEIFVQLLPPDDPRTTEARRSLARFYENQRERDTESEQLLLDALSTCERMRGTDQSALDCLSGTTFQLDVLYGKMGRDADTARLWRRGMAAVETKWGLDHPNVVPFLHNISHGAGIQDSLRFRDRIDSILDKAVKVDRPDAAYESHRSLFLALFGVLVDRYDKAGRKAEAEQALRFLARRFADRRAYLRLIELYVDGRRFAEAKVAYKVFAGEMENKLPNDPWIAADLVALYGKVAKFHHDLGDDTEASLYRRRARTIDEHMVLDAEPDQPQVAKNLALLADLYVDQQDYDDAAAALKRAIRIRENAWSTYGPRIGELRERLVAVTRKQGKDLDVDALSGDVIASGGDARRMCGAGELDVVSLLDDWPSRKTDMLGRCSVRDWNDLNGLVDPMMARLSGDAYRAEQFSGVATSYYGRNDWANALALYARAADLLQRVVRRNGAAPAVRPNRWTRTDEPALFSVRAAYELAKSESRRARELEETSFAFAQQTLRSSAASALAQMAVREAKGESHLAGLVRERQSLADEWQTLDKALAESVLAPAERRDVPSEQRQWARVGAIDARISAIDTILAEQFPDYAALAQSPSISLARTQELLRPDEALVLFLEAPDFRRFSFDETFVWVVTRTDVRWERIERRPTLGGTSLETRVAFMRCGLDRTNWAPDSETYAYCKALKQASGAGVSQASGQQPADGPAEWFDTTYAHELYRTLFGQVEDLIAGKHLLIVPSASLTQLPFYVLVTEKPDPARRGAASYADARWLIRRQSVAVLPSVGSLEVLRRMKPARALRPFIGFGDPLLDGRPGNPGEARRATLARARQSCGPTPAPGMLERTEAALQDLIGSLFRGALADVAVLRRQVPLPETTDELCAVARQLGAPASDVLLGERMTETAVKDLSREGRLRDYRILHFATHGLVAGDLENVAEPALMFSPPEAATELDDGLLTASEVAQLQLDADWVVMSACNTAAGASKNAQALSGLARAFFYAGARALLVSHWSVESNAAVAITTGAFAALKADRSIGRAEALRRSIQALIATGGRNAHPAVWAPFVLIGDGR